MDPSLQQAVKGNIVPLQEFLLQGSIIDSSKDVLIHRLRGLCDNADSLPETFSDHEIVFQMKGNNVTQQPITVYLRHSLVQPESWHLRYVGTAEAADKSRTLVRTWVDIGVSESAMQFLNEMGFKMDYEYVAQGYFFHKGRMKVTVSKLFKMMQPGAVDSLEPVSTSSLVELSVIQPAGQEQIGEDMKNFAEQLKPLVQLEKVDHRRLQQATP